MLNRLLPVLIVNLVAMNGNAADICSTLPECQQIGKQVDARIQAIQPSPQIGDIERNEEINEKGNFFMTKIRNLLSFRKSNKIEIEDFV